MPLYFSKKQKGFFDSDIHESIPDDAVEITPQDHAALMDAQAAGKVIDWGGSSPVAVDQPEPSADDLIKRQIVALEATVTQRRLREAVLGTDGGWLANVNSQIATLRAKLT